MKKLMLVLLVGLLVFVVAGCGEVENGGEVERAEREAVSSNMQEAQRQVGQPNIDDFYEKKLLKRIYELRDNSELITYSYITNLDGKFIYLGKSIGYGIPMSVQYNNPKKLINAEQYYNDTWYNRENISVIDQAEPNGLYMPSSMSATWIVLVDGDGSQSIMYIESELTVKQSKIPTRLCAEWSLPENY